MPAGSTAFTGWIPVHKRPAADTADLRRLLDLGFILGTLFLLDILTTELILIWGGVELNPLMVPIVANPFVHTGVKAAILLGIVIVSLVAEKEIRGSGVLIYCTLIPMYIFVIVNNVFVILPKVLV
jgi:hypothetical protein